MSEGLVCAQGRSLWVNQEEALLSISGQMECLEVLLSIVEFGVYSLLVDFTGREVAHTLEPILYRARKPSYPICL